jgi:hypothetical protein
MRGGWRLAVAVGAALTVFAATACGGDDGPTADPGATATSATPSPSSGCPLVSVDLVGSTFGVAARTTGVPSTAPFQDGTEYSCLFRADPVWSLSVSARAFTAPLSVDDLVRIGVSNQQFATPVSGVGDGAAYVKRSDLIQFVAVAKDADRARVVVLLGTSGPDDEARFSTIARQALQNTPDR